MILKPKELLLSLAANIGPLAPILIVAAAASVWFASNSINAAASNIKTSQNQTENKVTIDKLPITEEQAATASLKLSKLAPGTSVAVAGKALVISIKHPELFAEWIHALSEVQSAIKDVQWEFDDICLASCEGGESAKAYLTAYKRHIKLAESQ